MKTTNGSVWSDLMIIAKEIEPNLAFVRCCISEKQCIPIITGWNALFAFMKEQALLGVGFHGIERMKKEGVDVPRNVEQVAADFKITHGI